jgi:hypothetical protein
MTELLYPAAELKRHHSPSLAAIPHFTRLAMFQGLPLTP